MAALALLFVCCITISGINSLFGLQEQLSVKYAHESVNVMVVVVLLSFLPHGGRNGSVLDWKNVSGRISWRALLSVGGGLSLAGAVEWTGLSRRITEELSSLDFLTPLQTQVVLILLTTVLTEVNTNVVIARLLIPIASDIGVLTNVHPLYYALPVAMASCTPTVLPTAAPSIAVVTSCMDIQVVDILYPGLAVKLSSILLVLATVNTVGVSLFSLGDLPAWAVAKNGIMTGALANASSAA
ncbi:solute carrier family 13 member 2-like isoform X1 [Rhipicephalus microplus]|uniref:solute carrier family 13 member 2-like isoform X1 n=1 Tax=Rhipicephalus microplus TaxID=6941 RepID=UPI003F6BADA4